MRCFIAIDIDEQIKKCLSNLQSDLQAKVDIRRSDVKWVSPEATHLTLKFLGEIKDEQAVEVCSITREVASRHKCFDLAVESVGHFGSRSARVLWVGAGHDCNNLLQLQQDLDQELAAAGWPGETRKFAGHLTLCRIRNPKAGVKLVQAAREYEDLELGIMSVDSICVYESQLTPKGPIYTSMGNYDLQ